ncbi:MAG: glycerol-3-phosphate 1-O-acyltransferase PlsY [Alphaproteobacteria bacterium]|nr:glycerol-3-phosphate 1-O-acyltransferase PlsY [Alphaproteobacteria bacterium]
MLYIIGIFVAYILGSIPCGLIVSRILGYGDLRKIGSGNTGATNALRAGGLRLAILVWVLDMIKAIVAVLIGNWIGGGAFGAWCGFAAMFGHCFPVWLRFHGGKGVSCLFGILLAVNPLMFVICGIEWLVVALGFRYSSLGALVVFCLAPVLGFGISTGIGFAFLAMGLLCLYRHLENVGRLVGGTESKITWRWKK